MLPHRQLDQARDLAGQVDRAPMLQKPGLAARLIAHILAWAFDIERRVQELEARRDG